MQPCTMTQCLQPHGHFPAPPPYAFHDANAPHIMKTYSPKLKYPLPLCNCFCNPKSDIYPPESFPLDPLLPTPYLIPSHNQSLMTLMCFLQIPQMTIVIWDWDL